MRIERVDDTTVKLFITYIVTLKHVVLVVKTYGVTVNVVKSFLVNDG